VSTEARPYAAIAEQYARDVTRGKIPACQSIRLQAKRFLDELKLQRRRDFPFQFDVAKAERVCKFIERLPHTKGKWARTKETIRLEPWQVWIVCCVFGWLHKANGLRRFRALFLIVPRKNGKSAFAAAIGLYMLCADGEAGAEVYSGATNEKQAWEVFGPARIMAQRTPALCSKFGVDVNARSLVRVEDNSKFETIIGDPGDGQSPSCAIHDEYHEHKDDGQVDTMQTGMGARDQPLQVIPTTAGDNLAGPCYARRAEEQKKLAGIGHNGGPPLDDETFFVEYTIDEGDDWKSEAVLRKANPNFDVSVSGDFLRARQRDAIATPRKAGVFKTKELNFCGHCRLTSITWPPPGAILLGESRRTATDTESRINPPFYDGGRQRRYARIYAWSQESRTCSTVRPRSRAISDGPRDRSNTGTEQATFRPSSRGAPYAQAGRDSPVTSLPSKPQPSARRSRPRQATLRTAGDGAARAKSNAARIDPSDQEPSNRRAAVTARPCGAGTRAAKRRPCGHTVGAQ
jgi:hypothetical protein